MQLVILYPYPDTYSDKVFQAVSGAFGLDPQTLRVRRRESRMVRARFVCAYILHHHHHYSIRKIARLLNKRCHATVHHAIHTAEAQIPLYRDMNDAYREACGVLGITPMWGECRRRPSVATKAGEYVRPLNYQNQRERYAWQNARRTVSVSMTYA